MTAPATRRGVILGLAALPLTGAIIGTAVYRATGPDLGFVAECWLRDAYALGMLLMRQPDGEVWRAVPIFDGSERALARDAHWVRLENRPRLMRVVYAKARAGFRPWEAGE